MNFPLTDLVAAERLDRLVEHDLLLADVQAELCHERLGDLLAGDGAEELAVRAALGGDLHGAVTQLVRGLHGGGAVRRLLGAARLFLEVHGVDGVRRGGDGQLARQQIVAGVALRRVDHLALLALTSDVLL